MKAVVSVVGKDRTGITAAVATALAERDINIEDMSQTIMRNNFVMIMLVETGAATVAPDKLCEDLQKEVDHLGVVVHVQNDELFNAMHRI